MTENATIQSAIDSHQAGNLDQAESLYRAILQKEPHNADVIHLLGVLCFQKNDLDSATALLKQAIDLKPDLDDAYYNLASVLYTKGEWDEAIAFYQKILEKNPNLYEALNCIGNVFMEKNQLDEAIAYYRKALDINPEVAEIHNNLGFVLQKKGEFDEAIQCYQKALQIDPQFDHAYYNLGVVYQQKGLIDEAVSYYHRALVVNPDLPDVNNNLGLISQQKGKLDEAISYFLSAIELNHNFSIAYSNLGNTLVQKGQPDKAISIYQKALDIDPQQFQTHYDFGNALKESGDTIEAIRSYEKALELNPSFVKAHWAKCFAQLPVIYQDAQSIEKARNQYHQELIRLEESISLDTEENIHAAAEAVGSHQPFYLAAQGLNDRDLQQKYGHLVGRIMSAEYPHWSVRPAMPEKTGEKQIKIGIVSGHFYDHANWKIFTRGWVQNLDRNKFSLYGYYTGILKDNETENARKHFSRFVEDIFSFEKLCEIIRNDALHVLIFPELGIDAMTLRLASLRLAPVQCASWGHPDTSGLPTIDYYLGSDLMEPPDADTHYTEKLIRLPNLSVHYTPIESRGDDIHRSSLGIRQESVLYLCSHSLFTHLPQYDELYTRIAKEAGDCQFVFISHESSTVTAQFHNRIKNAFKSASLDSDKYVVMLPIPEPSEYHSLYCLADVFLDTIGWSDCNSTFEAIACNLPVVTLKGTLMRQRHAAAIFNMMALTDTVADTIDGYVKLAVQLGRDPEFRRRISDTITANRHRIYEDKECIVALEDFLENAVREKSKKQN